jgi:5'-nucleotidase (lipoprotein e(P4) family)
MSVAGDRKAVRLIAVLWCSASAGCVGQVGIATGATEKAAVPAAPRSEDCGTEALKRYHSSGKYALDLAQAGELAIARLRDKLAALPEGAKPAVVLDIDETCLSSWEILAEGNFCWDAGRFARLVARAEMPAITPVLDFFRFARSRGVTVFFITSREEQQRGATEKNLRAAGFGDYQGLRMRAPTGAADYKAAERRQIAADGFTILLYVGDQLGDLDAPANSILIPNPYYTTR